MSKRRPKFTGAELQRFRKSRVDLRGLGAINLKRSLGGRSLVDWCAGLRAACGGSDLSPQREMLVELAGRTRVLLDVVDSYLMSLPSFINRRYKKLAPIIAQRNQLAESLQKTLDRLGLDRVAKRVPTLEEYLASPEREAAHRAFEAEQQDVEEKTSDEAVADNS